MYMLENQYEWKVTELGQLLYATAAHVRKGNCLLKQVKAWGCCVCWVSTRCDEAPRRQGVHRLSGWVTGKVQGEPEYQNFQWDNKSIYLSTYLSNLPHSPVAVGRKNEKFFIDELANWQFTLTESGLSFQGEENKMKENGKLEKRERDLETAATHLIPSDECLVFPPEGLDPLVEVFIFCFFFHLCYGCMKSNDTHRRQNTFC